MQNITFFVEPIERPYETSWKMGKLYLNRFAIDENAAFEIQSIYMLSPMKGLGFSNTPDPNKEWQDSEIFKAGLRAIAEAGLHESKIHFMYVGNYIEYSRINSILESSIANGMKKYNINSVLLTTISQERERLITKEATEEYYDRKIQYSYDSTMRHGPWNIKISVNDDLESLFEDLKIGRKVKKLEWSYFLPELTEKDLQLVETRNESHLKTYICYWEPVHVYKTLYTYTGINWLKRRRPRYGDPDISKWKMKRSRSTSKFLKAVCFRWSFKFERRHLDAVEEIFEGTQIQSLLDYKYDF